MKGESQGARTHGGQGVYQTDFDVPSKCSFTIGTSMTVAEEHQETIVAIKIST